MKKTTIKFLCLWMVLFSLCGCKNIHTKEVNMNPCEVAFLHHEVWPETDLNTKLKVISTIVEVECSLNNVKTAKVKLSSTDESCSFNGNVLILPEKVMLKENGTDVLKIVLYTFYDYYNCDNANERIWFYLDSLPNF